MSYFVFYCYLLVMHLSIFSPRGGDRGAAGYPWGIIQFSKIGVLFPTHKQICGGQNPLYWPSNSFYNFI